MDFTLLLLRIFLAAIFGIAGTAKLLDLKGSKKAIEEFGVSELISKPLSILLPIAELLIAVSLLFVETSWFGALGGSGLLLIFIGGMLFQISKGNSPDCHCFGQIHSEPVSRNSVIRNIVFALAAGLLILAGRENQGTNLFVSYFVQDESKEYMQVLIGLAIVGLLAAIVYFLRQISEQQGKILRRIEILEVLSSGDHNHERGDIGHPDDGLPIGAPAPDFVLPDEKGKKVEFNHLLANRKPMLFFFVSPNCNPCHALIPEIKNWRNELGEKLDFIFVSSGEVKENEKKFGDISDRILIQKDREVAELFGAKWTPTIVLINSDGSIGSRNAPGDEAIRSLLEKIKEQSDSKNIFFIANGDSAVKKSRIGLKVPEFSTQDIAGKEFGADRFSGKKTLVTFWSETCPHCVGMLDDLRQWDKIKGQDEPNLVVFSSGDIEIHKKFDLKSPIILDQEYKIASEFGMSGTPSAVLVSENGEIISETAIGAPQIWALLGKPHK